jgi:pilus assembly protein CpaB
MGQGKFGTRPGKYGASSNPMVLVMGFFFLLFAVLGGVLFYISISQNKVESQQVNTTPMVQMVDVLVPLRDIKAGSELDPSLFAVESRPETGVPSKVIKSIENIRGKFAALDIEGGRPLVLDLVTDQRPSTTLQTRIPAGFRAVTIRVDVTSSVEGWARPGAKVDVTWIGTKQGESVAKTIVEAAEILSYQGQTKVDGNGAEQINSPSTVTLLVTKDDSLKIQLAQSTGRLSLTLRRDKDIETGTLENVINIDDVINTKDDKGQCREARKRGIMKIAKANGSFEEMVLNDLGELVPLSKYCSPKEVAPE